MRNNENPLKVILVVSQRARFDHSNEGFFASNQPRFGKQGRTFSTESSFQFVQPLPCTNTFRFWLV